MGFVGWRRQTPPVRTPCSCYPGAAEGPYEIVELLAQTPLSMACTAWQHVLGLSIESHDFLVEPEWAFLVSLAPTQRCKLRDLFGSPGRATHGEPSLGPWNRFKVSTTRHATCESDKTGGDKRAQLLLTDGCSSASNGRWLLTLLFRSSVSMAAHALRPLDFWTPPRSLCTIKRFKNSQKLLRQYLDF